MPATSKFGHPNTKRRNKIMLLRSQGLRQTEIAKKLGISGGTVSYYLSTMNGTKPAKLKPIVSGATTEETKFKDEVQALVDAFWENLPLEEKVKVMRAVEVGE
jgi:predicted transcriptional regulator